MLLRGSCNEKIVPKIVYNILFMKTTSPKKFVKGYILSQKNTVIFDFFIASTQYHLSPV